MGVSWPNFADWRNRIQAFEAVAATRQDAFTLTGLGPAFRIRAAQVSPAFFPLLSVAPRMGRTFTDQEDVPGATPVVLLTENFWRANLRSDPNVLAMYRFPLPPWLANSSSTLGSPHLPNWPR